MAKLRAIVHGRIVLEDGILEDGVILFSNGVITDFGPFCEVEIPDDAERMDAAGLYVGPGFVDIHVHGGGGFSSYFEPDEAARWFLTHGTTSFLAAIPYQLTLEEMLSSIAQAKAALGRVESLRGIYMEGPYTNPDYGSHADKNPWRHGIRREDYQRLVDACGRAVRVWTVAPEREGILDFCRYARSVNPSVVFAVGHSEALPEEIRALGPCRPLLETHAMNATGRRPVPAGTRGIGPDEYFLKEPQTYCELISDSCGIHVHPELQELLLYVKTARRLILITDSTTHENPAPEALRDVDDLNFDSAGGLAGSRLTMDKACRNFVKHTGASLSDAFLMASGNPARAVGLYDSLGSIALGKRADLVLLDESFSVKAVFLGGEPVFGAEEPVLTGTSAAEGS